MNLLRIVRNDLRQSIIRSDLARHANLFVLEIIFGLPELASIASPNHDGEDLIRVWFVQIEERGLAL